MISELLGRKIEKERSERAVLLRTVFKNTAYLERGMPYFAFVSTNAVLRKAELRTTTRLSFFDQAIKVTQAEPSPVGEGGPR